MNTKGENKLTELPDVDSVTNLVDQPDMLPLEEKGEELSSWDKDMKFFKEWVMALHIPVLLLILICIMGKKREGDSSYFKLPSFLDRFVKPTEKKEKVEDDDEPVE